MELKEENAWERAVDYTPHWDKREQAARRQDLIADAIQLAAMLAMAGCIVILVFN